MCGIAGELRFDGSAPDRNLIDRMTARLARRGPDASGHHFDGPLGMGHRRLSIIDLSDRSRQPMVDQESGLALVFNGTIYNYPELRTLLLSRGHHFMSDGDTEVILRAYAEWGSACIERLYGVFAFAIWDPRAQTLMLGRDRLGIKPLYYTLDNHRLRFASTTQALLTGGDIDTHLDAIALHHLFSLHSVVPPPYTVLSGIAKLAPAHSMLIDTRGNSRLRQYWQLTAHHPDPPWREEEWLHQVRTTLDEAVRRRITVADVKVGVLLSGGLDSSLLVGLLAKQGVKDLMTFSIGFEDQPEEQGSEFEYSDAVAHHFGTRHHQFRIPNREVMMRFPEAVDEMAEPMFSQDAVAFFLLAERVSQTVKVVQSGQGADEVFGGYFWYPRMMQDKTGTPLERFRRHYFDRDHAEYLEMMAPCWHSADHSSRTIDQYLHAPGADEFIDQVLRMDVTMLITDDPVKRVDNMTMAWGLEARVPFLDHQVVELAARMPAALKLNSGGKHLLKRMARGMLPDGIIDRPKGYFPVPALKYLRGPFLDFVRGILDSQACRNRGLYQRSYVEKLLAAPEQYHTRILGSKLWHLALLELWLQRNVDGIHDSQSRS